MPEKDKTQFIERGKIDVKKNLLSLRRTVLTQGTAAPPSYDVCVF
jgi:hypothetical protein